MFKTIFKIFLVNIILLFGSSAVVFAQIDSEAVVILDSMSDVVTDLESCSFTLKTEYDIYNTDLGLVKHSDIAKVYMKAPDKLLVNRKGDKGNKNFYYDGKTFTYFSADNNQYADLPAPPTIMETIDSISSYYGVEFPAADIFYTDLVDSILANANILSLLGFTNIFDKECYHLAGRSDEMSYQVWIANDGTFLPVKMAIVYTSRPGQPQYEAVFQEWNVNPVLDNSMFDFVVPADAVKIKFIKK
jgi:hypothetical protein